MALEQQNNPSPQKSITTVSSYFHLDKCNLVRQQGCHASKNGVTPPTSSFWTSGMTRYNSLWRAALRESDTVTTELVKDSAPLVPVNW